MLLRGFLSVVSDRLYHRRAGTPKLPALHSAQASSEATRALMAAANVTDPEAKPLKNAESIRRWLRDGAKRLEYTTGASDES